MTPLLVALGVLALSAVGIAYVVLRVLDPVAGILP